MQSLEINVLSQGGTKCLTLEDNTVMSEICHIEGVNATSARYNPNLDSDYINGVDNLILLCPNHHTIIDKNESTYSVAVLKQIKVLIYN